jgi:hypothetical protein
LAVEMTVPAPGADAHPLGLPPEPPPISTEPFPSIGLRGPPFLIA